MQSLNFGGFLEQAQSRAAEAQEALQKAADQAKSKCNVVKDALEKKITTYVTGSTHRLEDRDGRVREVIDVAIIAEGGFGVVSRVRDSKSGEEFALKRIACAERSQVASSLEAAETEVKVLTRLPAHPGILRAFGSSTETAGDGKLVKLLLELCEGGHLLDWLNSKDGNISAVEVLHPFYQVAEAVRFLHSMKPPIQHRDLKVENILQTAPQSRTWKLCDFGSASVSCFETGQSIPRPKLIRLQEDIDKTVTMLYRPPEMVDISLNDKFGYFINEQVDMWMMGCILFTLMFYKHPFQDNATAMAITNAKYFIPREHRHARQPKLCGILHWLLAPHPRDRLSSRELCDVLQNIKSRSYEDLHDMMPAKVQAKIKQLADLYTSRRSSKDEDFQPDSKPASGRSGNTARNGFSNDAPPQDLLFDVASPQQAKSNVTPGQAGGWPSSSATTQQEDWTASWDAGPWNAPPSAQQQKPSKQALDFNEGFDFATAGTPAPAASDSCGFDLASCLASEAAAPNSGGYAAAPAPAAARAASAPIPSQQNNDLLSFMEAPAAKPTAPANTASNDLLCFDAAPMLQSTPVKAPPANNSGWADFDAFNPQAAPSQPATMQRAATQPASSNFHAANSWGSAPAVSSTQAAGNNFGNFASGNSWGSAPAAPSAQAAPCAQSVGNDFAMFDPMSPSQQTNGHMQQHPGGASQNQGRPAAAPGSTNLLDF